MKKYRVILSEEHSRYYVEVRGFFRWTRIDHTGDTGRSAIYYDGKMEAMECIKALQKPERVYEDVVVYETHPAPDLSPRMAGGYIPDADPLWGREAKPEFTPPSQGNPHQDDNWPVVAAVRNCPPMPAVKKPKPSAILPDIYE